MNNIMLLNGLLIGLAIAAGFAPFWIPFFKHLKLGQFIRQEGPQAHLAKAGTPTFGGTIFLFAALLGSLALQGITPAVFSVLIAMFGYGTIGFIDDYLKVIMKHNQGLSAKGKMLGLLAVTAVLYFVFFSGHISIFYFQLFSLQGALWAIAFFVIALAVTNAVNLTDGIDGLCGSVSLIVALFFAALSFKRGIDELALFNMIVAGGLLGYVIYNWHPAKIFMGDMGSLALGGYVLANSVLLGIEWWLPLFGLVYVLETLSVIIQVTYFKATGGKRFFKMTPIHHHFELSGWSETNIVSRASMFTALLCVLSFILL